MGQSWKLPVYRTSEAGELMVRADHPALSQAARAIGRDLHWSIGDLTLTGDEGMSLGVDQSIIGERELTFPPRAIEGAVHVPISSLEELLSAKVTVKPGVRGAIYLEPTLAKLSFIDEDDTGAVLRVETSVPVRRKVFKLSNPSRTVVDLVGVSLHRSHPGLQHPGVGTIKIGLFQSAPSITRIVIPSDDGVKVETPRSLDLFEHKIAMSWPAGRIVSNSEPQPVAVQTPVEMEPTVQIAKVPTVKIPKTPTRQEPVVTINRRTKLLSAKWEGNRLRLDFSEPVQYRWSRLDDRKHRFLLDFPGVIFPQKKTQLKSSVPGLSNVRIVQNMPEPDPIVRLVCDLQVPLAVNTDGKAEKTLYLEFPGRKIARGEITKGVGHTGRTAPKGSAGGRTICLDAGHGGSDPGAMNPSVGISEKKVTLDITLRLAKMLRAEGWNVVLTRSVDRDVSWAGSSGKQELGARARTANKYGADLFVSIHCNASPKSSTHGTSIHWYKSGDLRLARHMEGSVMHGTGRKNRGLIKNRFYVLAHTTMPAVLVETAFLSNPKEGRLLASPAYRERIARGVAAGLRQYAAHNFPTRAASK